MFKALFFLFCVVPSLAVTANNLTIESQYEGVYRISLNCQGSDSYCEQQKYFKDMSFILSRRPQGLAPTANLVRNDFRMMVYQFDVRHTMSGGQIVEGDSFDQPGRPAEFYAELNASNHTARVWVRDPQYRVDLMGEGTLEGDVGAVFQVAKKLPVEQIVGNYEVELSGSQRGALRILQTKNPRYPLIASFHYNHVNVRFDFLHVDIDPQSGAVSLFSEIADGNYLRWSLALHPLDKNYGSGLGFSTSSGKTFPLKLYKP